MSNQKLKIQVDRTFEVQYWRATYPKLKTFPYEIAISNSRQKFWLNYRFYENLFASCHFNIIRLIEESCWFGIWANQICWYIFIFTFHLQRFIHWEIDLVTLLSSSCWVEHTLKLIHIKFLPHKFVNYHLVPSNLVCNWWSIFPSLLGWMETETTDIPVWFDCGS